MRWFMTILPRKKKKKKKREKRKEKLKKKREVTKAKHIAFYSQYFPVSGVLC